MTMRHRNQQSRSAPGARTFVAVVVLAVVTTSCGLFDDSHGYQKPLADDDRPWILVDLRHTEIQNPVDYRLHRAQYNYQGTYGFYRLFEHLERHDFPWAPTDEPLSTPRLTPYDILFINLVHDRMPDFTDDEVEAIQEFVADGGGLFVIGDHTNVYRHAERINPILEPMGLEMMYHTVTDQPPVYSVSGLGWIMVFDFADHPINDGVEMISFKTGGPVAAVDPDDDLAMTSEESFADFWNPDNDEGYYGNWKQGDDEELEPSGPLSVASATEYGDGRAVLVGDQNIFGDAWINLGHNFDFATNAFEWLAGREDTDEPMRDQPRRGHNIAFESDVNYFQVARNAPKGYYTTFVETNRNEAVTARATPSLELDNTDTLMLVSSDIEFDVHELNDRAYTDDQLDEIQGFLSDGGRVVISFEPHDIPEPTVQLLEALTGNFALEMGDKTWLPGDDEVPAPKAIDGFHPIDSTAFDVDGLRLGTLAADEFPSDDDYLGDAASYQPGDFDAHLYDVRAQNAVPLVEADTGDAIVTVAAKKRVGDGELIIFPQDGFWRNQTMGSEELLEPTSFFRRDIVDFHHRFLDYLVATE